MRLFKLLIFLYLFVFQSNLTYTQNRYELNSGWQFEGVSKVKEAGEVLSQPSYQLSNWLQATVPGTVLTNLLNNKRISDPFYGMNNKYIPDIYNTGNEYYTYWFVNDFKEISKPGEQVWLQLRGVNYKCNIYINGKRINQKIHEGMLLRQQYNITNLLAQDGNNRLAIIVYPPDITGNPNGGQGGDGTIARNATTPYTAGWDWIQPVRDRNTGIWDKVFIEKTKTINIANPHIITSVPGIRFPDAAQQPAIIKVTAEVENPSKKPVSGTIQYIIDGVTVKKNITLGALSTSEIRFPDYVLRNPKLWWPNGYGKQDLYQVRIEFISNGQIWDDEKLSVGIRQIDNIWNDQTRSMQTMVNGQKIFIKGGNWIVSDAMLRLSKERYDAEIRFHRDMNLNLIRIWGGALTERPEFYEACDKYGMLVFQDFWFSGDCNGRWLDPMKKDDQWKRRKYPDDHSLILQIATDQIKLIRNYASLAYWCGGNEITPPDDILIPLRDSILPKLDGTRYFFDFSNSDSMSFNSIGGNGDGPYTIQDDKTFWTYKTFPYNSEVGSVGVGDYESLQRFIPLQNLLPPVYGSFVDSVWDYHKYISYDNYINNYGRIKNARDFTIKAQLVNYNQYRALVEGFSSHMWDWYTGTIIWKTQNPWTALRGQMYDCYLDVNACLYGLRKGGEVLHVMMNPADSMLLMVNNGFKTERNLMIEVKIYDILTGRDSLYSYMFNEIGSTSVKKLFSMSGFLKGLGKSEGVFVSLKLSRENKSLISENFYWLPGLDNTYSALQKMPPATLDIKVEKIGNHKLNVSLRNPVNGIVAFFNRIALLDVQTGERILPSFFTDNYLSVLPGETKMIQIEYPENFENISKLVQIYGWNVTEQKVIVK